MNAYQLEVAAYEQILGRSYQEWKDDPTTNRRVIETKRYEVK